MASAQVFDRQPGIRLPEEAHDLRFGESFLHRSTLSLGPNSKPECYSNPGGRRGVFLTCFVYAVCLTGAYGAFLASRLVRPRL